MDRKQILKEFEVNEHGFIETHGKFEGEALYAPYFHSLIMDGCSDETLLINGQTYDIFDIEDADVQHFPELKEDFDHGDVYMKCWTSDHGFFYCTPIPKERLEAMRKEEAIDIEENKEQ